MSTQPEKLWCCGCQNKVEARLTDGGEIYPHRSDLAHLPFWICDTCKNYVGCHHRTNTPTKPLGCIPTAALRKRRQEIHEALDWIWQSKLASRAILYRRIAEELGVKEFHTASIDSVQQAELVIELLVSWYGNRPIVEPAFVREQVDKARKKQFAVQRSKDMRAAKKKGVTDGKHSKGAKSGAAAPGPCDGARTPDADGGATDSPRQSLDEQGSAAGVEPAAVPPDPGSLASDPGDGRDPECPFDP